MELETRPTNSWKSCHPASHQAAYQYYNNDIAAWSHNNRVPRRGQYIDDGEMRYLLIISEGSQNSNPYYPFLISQE